MVFVARDLVCMGSGEGCIVTQTETDGSSESLAASTHPAVPAPMIR